MPDPDFRLIIAELDRAIGLYQVAKLMHRQYIQVKRWANGQEPKYHDGAMLLMIHTQYVKHGPPIAQDAPGTRETETAQGYAQKL